jgi:hypothetical protein
MATAATGRNDSCPCGSGKKYKKCCLARDEQRAEAGYPNLPSTPSAADGGGTAGVQAYTILRMLDYPTPELERLMAADPQLAQAMAGRLSIVQVAAMTDEALLDQLRRCGIEATPERFRELARGTSSAWGIGERWAPSVNRLLTVNETDFLSLAACELWKRWCPDPPSVEMLDDWMQDGYTARERLQGGLAVELWLKTWGHLHRRFTPDMRQCGDSECVFNGTQALFNWTQDLADALLDIARNDRRYAAPTVRYAREVLSQFTLENRGYLNVFHTALAAAYFLDGQPQEGEAFCRALIAADPFSACGYVTFAEALVLSADGRPDYVQSIALLQQALDMPVQDAGDWDVASRLEYMRKEREYL